MPEKSVSVIIPVYNVENYLAACLESVINQTYKNLDIICVEDCSTDNSLKILEEFAEKDKRITIIKHSKNSGLSAARNSGLDLALSQGEPGFICFVDSDDTIEPDTIEKSVNAFTEDIDAVVFHINPVYSSDIDENCYLPSNFNEIKYNGTYSPTEEIIANTPELATNKLYRKEILKNNNIRFARGLIHEDVSFHLIYLFTIKGCIHFIPERFYNYNIHDNSLSINSKKNGLIYHRTANFYYTRRFFERNNNIEVLFTKYFINWVEKYFLIEFSHCKTIQTRKKQFNLAAKTIKDFPLSVLFKYANNIFICLLLRYNLFYIYLFMYKLNWQLIKLKALCKR